MLRRKVKLSQRIKILHVLTGGLRVEGITSTLLSFFQIINAENFQIDVAAVHRNSQEMIREYQKVGCRVIEFSDRTDKTVTYFFELLKYMRKQQYDIVHVHGSSALMSIELLIAKLAGVPVRIAHSRNTKADNIKMDKLLRPLFNHLYTDGIACGEGAGKWLFGGKEFTVLHNGKDLSKFRYDVQKREEEREKYGFGNSIVIGHVGAFNKQKNQVYLIAVFAEFLKSNDNAVLYLIGDGGTRPMVLEHAQKLGIEDKIMFAGNVRDMPQRLQAMDIMVFPSRFEGLPNVVLEWQAEGLPCLISDKITKECALSDLVEFASIDDNPKVWANKMNHMLMKYNDREAQAKRGTQALKENGFDIVDTAKKLENIYLEMLQR